LKEVPELMDLNAMFREESWEELRWESTTLPQFCGSGVMIDAGEMKAMYRNFAFSRALYYLII